MVFNDTSGGLGLIQDCEYLCGLRDAAISGDAALLKHFTRNINAHYHKVATMILSSQDEWDWDDLNKTDYPISLTSLVASQQDYSLPASLKILKIKRVEVTYDGTNWYRAEPIDINEVGVATDTTTVTGNFSVAAPRYDVQNNSIFLYPIPTANSTNGLKIWYSREPTEFTTASTTTEPGFDEPFHRLLSIGASLDFALAKGRENANELAALYADYERRLREHYGSKDKDRVYALRGSYENYE